MMHIIKNEMLWMKSDLRIQLECMGKVSGAMMITEAHVYFVFLVALLVSGVQNQNLARGDTTELVLLNVQPYPDNRDGAGWDRGFELIPAGRIAEDQINNRTDLLPGINLRLIDVESEACGSSMINRGLVNTYSHLYPEHVSKRENVVGVVGLFCSTVTNVIAPLASFPSFSYLQIAGSTSPLHRDVAKYPWLFHAISSSTVFNKVLISMMRAFKWRRVTVVHDSSGFFFVSTAADFEGLVEKSSGDIQLVSSIPVTPTSILDIFPNLITLRAKIIYVLGTVGEAAQLLCDAFHRRAVWPGYVYILTERTISNIIDRVNATSCTEDELLSALNNIFLLQYGLTANSTSKLVSGWTYNEYYHEYLNRLDEFESETNSQNLDRNNIYANVQYDEVWAFALALNNSLDEINASNVSLTNRHHASNITAIVAKALMNIDFQGASGLIQFDGQESTSSVEIYQVKNNVEELVGIYHPYRIDQLTLLNIKVEDIPLDTFETRILLLPLWLTITFFIVTVLCIALTFLILLIFICFQSKPEIKASSPYLSLVMFIGCCFCFIAANMRTLHRGIEITSNIGFTVICNIEVWLGSTGMNFIFATLLVRLVRIHHVFKAGNFRGKTKYLSDTFLFLYILGICSIGVVILIIWTAIDKIKKVTVENYLADAVPPIFEVQSTCSSNNLGIWLVIAFSYSGIIIALVVFMAIQTRKVKLKNFKDTKSVNSYIFIIVIVLAIVLPLWFVFENAVHNDVLAHIILSLGFISLGLLCQLFIFLPRALVLLLNSVKSKTYVPQSGTDGMLRRQTQFAITTK